MLIKGDFKGVTKAEAEKPEFCAEHTWLPAQGNAASNIGALLG